MASSAVVVRDELIRGVERSEDWWLANAAILIESQFWRYFTGFCSIFSIRKSPWWFLPPATRRRREDLRWCLLGGSSNSWEWFPQLVESRYEKRGVIGNKLQDEMFFMSFVITLILYLFQKTFPEILIFAIKKKENKM